MARYDSATLGLFHVELEISYGERRDRERREKKERERGGREKGREIVAKRETENER